MINLLSFKLNFDTLSYDKVNVPLDWNMPSGEPMFVNFCRQFTDNRRFIYSGRCLFTLSSYTMVVDIRDIDAVEPEDYIFSRRILYTPKASIRDYFDPMLEAGTQNKYL